MPRPDTPAPPCIATYDGAPASCCVRRAVRAGRKERLRLHRVAARQGCERRRSEELLIGSVHLAGEGLGRGRCGLAGAASLRVPLAERDEGGRLSGPLAHLPADGQSAAQVLLDPSSRGASSANEVGECDNAVRAQANWVKVARLRTVENHLVHGNLTRRSGTLRAVRVCRGGPATLRKTPWWRWGRRSVCVGGAVGAARTSQRLTRSRNGG